eukprot:scaffold1026_cov68-Phaeocystis_antarctica.AAC.1
MALRCNLFSVTASSQRSRRLCNALAPLSSQSRPGSCPWILAQALLCQTFPAQAVRSPRRT